MNNALLVRDRQERGRAVCGLSFVVAAAALPRLFGLAKHSLWLDEGITLQQVGVGSFSDVLDGLLASGISRQGHSVYILLLFLWRELLGDSDFVLRLFSAVLGVGAVALIYVIARRTFGPRHALWSTVFSAVSAYSLLHSQEARPYALAIFASCLFLWQYISVRSAGGGAPGLAGVFLTSLLVVAVSVFSFFMLYAVVLADVLLNRARRDLWRTWLMALLPSVPVGLYFAAVYVDSASQLPGALTSTRSAFSHLLFVGYALMAGQTLGPPIDVLREVGLGQAVRQYGFVLLALGVAAAFVGGRAVLVLFRPHRYVIGREVVGHGRLMALAFCIAALVGFVHTVVLDFNWLPRHAFYLFPFLALLLPLSLVRSRQASRWAVVPGLMFLVVLALNLVSAWNYFFVPAYARDDYRGVAAYLRQEDGADGARVLLIGDLGLLRHYGNAETLSGLHLVRSAVFGRDLRELVAEDTVQVELILNRGSVFREKYLKFHGMSFEEALRRCCVLEETRRFALFEVHRVTFRDVSSVVVAE